MLYVITFGLTIVGSWAIIRITTKYRNKQFNKILYKQSDLHNIMKHFFSQTLLSDKKTYSQLNKYKEDKMVKVIIIQDKAYWVSNNKFYIADAVEGNPIQETAKELDTQTMSDKEVKKMLFILDSLNNGEINDRGSAGNERL
jgi:hypothetical protein